MNKLYLFAVFLSVLGLTYAMAAQKEDPKEENDESSNSSEEFREFAKNISERYNTTLFLDIIKVGEKVKEKCPKIEDKLDDVFGEMWDCLQAIDFGPESLCTTLKKNYAKCTKPARQVVIDCLPEESKELPILSEKIIEALIEQSCHSTLEEILELFNPCSVSEDPESFPACKEIKTTIDQHRNKLPSKALVCETLPKTRNCAKAILEASCKLPITRNAWMKFHDAVENAIKDDCASLNKVIN